MSAKRQKNQLVLAFAEEGRSEALKPSREGTESLTAKCDTERPSGHEQLCKKSASGITAGRLTSKSKRTKAVRESTA